MNFSSVINEKIISSSPLSGGCIGSCYRVKTSSHDYFIKYYSKKGISREEAQGIKELEKSNTVKVPEVLKVDDHFLVLKFIFQTSKVKDFQEILGTELAMLHKTTASQFGFYENNHIGSTPQINKFKKTWIDFYLENRLDYQVSISGDKDIIDTYKKLRVKIPEILEESLEEPCLIHGDLWGGNVISNEAGEPVLIDPAVYYGNREMELAMTRLFGGFTSEFYNSYNSEFPLLTDWKERQNLYKLYHILNHFNLFGSSYKHQALELMKGY
ncbi:MAG: fructosamine kinase family protein [Spirochaetales bacterium]|nr:fructosamine kinase family protein [Spirochaetales bacterium]